MLKYARNSDVNRDPRAQHKFSSINNLIVLKFMTNLQLLLGLFFDKIFQRFCRNDDEYLKDIFLGW